MLQRLLVGIGGSTAAGKTTLVRILAERFADVSVVDLDSYYLDRSRIPPQERSALNYDEPTAFDVTLLVDHLRRLAAGETVRKPHYSFESHTRTGFQPLAPASLLLVEGLLALWWEELRTLFDLKVFVDAPADLRLLRRIHRDVTERGRNIESVLAQYLQTVRPMHERYVEPSGAQADIVVMNTGAVEECVEPVIAAVRSLLGRPTLKMVRQ